MQVIEGQDIRLLNIGPPDDIPIIMVRSGKKNDSHGQSDELLELLMTSEITTQPGTAVTQEHWAEWDT